LRPREPAESFMRAEANAECSERAWRVAGVTTTLSLKNLRDFNDRIGRGA
jgi:hypothetical protein